MLTLMEMLLPKGLEMRTERRMTIGREPCCLAFLDPYRAELCCGTTVPGLTMKVRRPASTGADATPASDLDHKYSRECEPISPELIVGRRKRRVGHQQLDIPVQVDRAMHLRCDLGVEHARMLPTTAGGAAVDPPARQTGIASRRT